MQHNTLNVNTIEYGGQKAVINSCSDYPELVEGMNRQREEWAARFPRATVRTERLTYDETRRLVAEGKAKGDHLYSHCWAVGWASQRD